MYAIRCLLLPATLFAMVAHGAPKEFEPEITKEIALKAVALFRNDPLSENGRGAAAIVLHFADKSQDVVVRLSSKSFPIGDLAGASQEEQDAILSAFIVGNVDSQLLRGIKQDDPYAGDLQLIETYRELQRRNPKLTLPAVEKLAELESHGQLKEYLSSK